ncbi:MAG: hypothetical protein P9X24_02265 [Candidatus Hatepunaea meridiana]|nr:hypothetical protein [Candidatus Hatepunaea meridiana]
MRFQRAISKYLKDNIPNLHAFKDEIAFVAAGNPYPYFLIDLISTRKSQLGTGLWDRTEDNDDGTATKIKVFKHSHVFRFTVRAINTNEQNGNEVVADICDKMDNHLSDLCRFGSIDLTDLVTGDNIHIESALFQGRSDLAPIEKGMPFIYQQSLSYMFVEHRFKTKQVEHRVESIKIDL